MKRRSLTAISLGLAWMVSLGGVFILGMLLAFAIHLGPEAGQVESGSSLKERHLSLLLEELCGEPADLATVMRHGDDEEMVPQLEEALRAILRMRSPEDQTVAAYRMVACLPERRLLGSIRFLRGLNPEPARDRVLGRFLEAWGGIDGRSAILFSSKLSGNERHQSMASILRGWSRADPVEAWNWVMERETNPRLGQRWVAVILEDQALLNRTLALELLEKLPAGAFQDRMALLIFDQILGTELPSSSLAWLGQLPESVASAAYGRVAEAMAATDPIAALEWLREVSPADQETIELIVTEWGTEDPASAINWAWEQLEGFSLSRCMDVLAEIWLDVAGPAPLAEWLNIHGPGEVLDGPIESLAMETLEIDPATALVWAQSVSIEEDRVMLEMLIGRQWLQRSPEEAMENLPVLLQSPEAKATLLGNARP